MSNIQPSIMNYIFMGLKAQQLYTTMENFQVKVRRILTFDATIAELAKFISKIMRQMTIPQDEFKIKKIEFNE